MAPVRRFEDFDCWKLANELKLAVYELVQRAHVKPDREFCDQIRSAVASAPANIAEAFGRRSALDSLASRAVGAVAGLQRYLRRRKQKRG